MSTLENPPLLEAIFEVRWGETSPGEFTYSNFDQALFTGKLSAIADQHGFTLTEMISDGTRPTLPMEVTHRFRKEENTWPCLQAGLGVFTVNQTADDYSWKTFQNTIQLGMEIFDKSGPKKISSIEDSLTLILRYHDLFYIEDGMSTEDYLKNNFHIEANLPNNFFSNEFFKPNSSSIRCQFNLISSNPKGEVIIKFANAIIDDKPGLLLETLVIARSSDFSKQIDTPSILEWANQAHILQKHAFNTLVNSDAYY